MRVVQLAEKDDQIAKVGTDVFFTVAVVVVIVVLVVVELPPHL